MFDKDKKKVKDEKEENKENDVKKDSEEIDEKKETTVSKADYDKMQEQYTKALSTAAYYENQGKYYKNEYDRFVKYRSQAIIEDLLPVLDGFELAFRADAPNKEAQSYRVGFEYIYKMMQNVLTNEGVSVISTKQGEKFDSTKHQVMDVVETEDEKLDNTIVEHLLNGYMLKDRLIRPASVKVYKIKKVEEAKVEEVKEEKKEENNSSKEAKN